MQPSSIRLALAAGLTLSLSLACAPSGGPDGGTGVCGGSQAKCASVVDCCTGFECSLGSCVFVGGGNNGNNGNNSNGGGASSAGGNSAGIGGTSAGIGGSSGGSHGSGSSGGLGSTGHGTSGGGSTGHPGNSSGGNGSSGASGYSPDLCSACGTFTGCTGPSDICVCDPTDNSCAQGYCAGSCGTGEQSLCPAGTDCLGARVYGSVGEEDYVCYPESGSCLASGGSSGGSTGGGISSGGSSGGATSGYSPDLCAICATASSSQSGAGCTSASDLCVYDPTDTDEQFDGYCAGDCLNATTMQGDQTYCPKGTTCTTTVDWEQETTDYVCYPSDGTCLDAGAP